MFLIVRSKDQIKKTEKFLSEYGLIIKSFAVSSIEHTRIDIKEGDEGFIVTSPNAVLSVPQTKLPFFCVGEASEQEAKETGRRIAYVGYKDATDMAKKIAKIFPPEKLVHASGDMADTSWYKILEKAGISVEMREAYKTVYAEDFDAETLSLLTSSDLKGIVFFSAMGAKVFQDIMAKNKLSPASFNAVVFSPAIAQACKLFKAVFVSNNPHLNDVKNTMLSLSKS